MAKKLFLPLLACAIAALAACSLPQFTRDDAELKLDKHYAMCLTPEQPADSPQLTDCVLARYEEEQRQVARVREALYPAPPPPPILPYSCDSTATPNACLTPPGAY